MPSSHGSLLPPGWAELLEEVQRSLDRSVARATEQERALGAAPAAVSEEAQQQTSRCLASCADRLRQFHSSSQDAERQAAEVDAALQRGEDGINAWLARAAAVRRKLADLEGRAV